MELSDLVIHNEEWRDVPGYEGLYRVSSFGRVQGQYKRFLKERIDRGGYRRVVLCNGGTPSGRLIHRLVCAAFIGEIRSGNEVNHINNIRNDNRSENLEYVTRIQNMRYKRNFGTDPALERNPRAKLDRHKVKAIRQGYANGKIHIQLAAEFGVSKSLVGAIIRRECWSSVA